MSILSDAIALGAVLPKQPQKQLVRRLLASFSNRRFQGYADGGCAAGVKRLVVLFVIPVLILALVAVVPTWPYNKNWNYYPAGGMGALLVLTIVLLFLNRI